MFSIEINSHSLVYLGLLVAQKKLPSECLDVSLFNSQTCEGTFRSCRSMSGPFSSVVNFTVHQFLQRAKKLSYLHHAQCRHRSDSFNELIFPNHHKLRRRVDKKQAASASPCGSTLTIEAIEHRVLQAYQKATDLLRDTNMFSGDGMLSLLHMSQLFQTQLESSRLVDRPLHIKRDAELRTSSDDSSSEEEDDVSQDDTDEANSMDSDDHLTDNLFDVSSSVFEGTRVFDSINPLLSKSYFSVDFNGGKKFLHKQTAAWLLSKDKTTLSADRLKRVITDK